MKCAVAVLALILVGCGGEYVWRNSRANLGPAAFQDDSNLCRNHARKEFPARDEIRTISGTSSRVACKEKKDTVNCTVTPGSAPHAYIGDANEYSRGRAYEECLLRLGWYKSWESTYVEPIQDNRPQGPACKSEKDCDSKSFCRSGWCTPFYSDKELKERAATASESRIKGPDYGATAGASCRVQNDCGRGTFCSDGVCVSFK